VHGHHIDGHGCKSGFSSHLILKTPEKQAIKHYSTRKKRDNIKGIKQPYYCRRKLQFTTSTAVARLYTLHHNTTPKVLVALKKLGLSAAGAYDLQVPSRQQRFSRWGVYKLRVIQMACLQTYNRNRLSSGSHGNRLQR
jgi:hypothetical protein